MWTIIGGGVGLAGLGTGGFTLLWRYIAAAEKRSEARTEAVERRAEARSDAVEKRAEARLADLKADLKSEIHSRSEAAEARFADLKADILRLTERMERNHTDLRQAIDTLVLADQAKRLTVLEEAVLRTARPPDDREAQH